MQSTRDRETFKKLNKDSDVKMGNSKATSLNNKITPNRAQEIIQQISKKFISSHDIVNRINHPHYYVHSSVPKKLSQYKIALSQYRVEISTLLDNLDKQGVYKKLLSPHADYNQLGIGSFFHGIVATQVLSSLGIGECAERCCHLAIKLTQVGMRNLTFIGLEFPQADEGMEKTHQIILTNYENLPNLSQQISKPSYKQLFSAFPDNTIVCDPFLGLSFYAHHIPKLFSQYIQAYGGKAIIKEVRPMHNLSPRSFNNYIHVASDLKSRFLSQKNLKLPTLTEFFPKNKKSVGNDKEKQIRSKQNLSQKELGKMTHLKPLFKVQKSQYVWYADKPPRLGGIPRKITISELEKLVGNNFQYSENLWIDPEQKFINPKLGDNGNTAILSLLENRLSTQHHDHLVICHMGNKVGYGVFARQNIEVGDIVAIYSGCYSNRQTIKDNEYCAGGNGVTVDAKNRGGIARFFQHLPTMVERNYKMLEKISQNKKLWKQHLIAEGDRPREYLQRVISKPTDLVNSGYSQSIRTKKYLTWEEDSIEFHDRSAKSRVANNSLKLGWVMLNKMPVYYLFAPFSIQAGQQLGFSYEVGYWCTKGYLPLLFDQDGGLLDKRYYSHIRIPVSIPMFSESPRAFFYTREQYETDVENQYPVQLCPYTKPLSFFNLRDRLVKEAVINDSHRSRDFNTIAKYLKKLLPDDVRIRLYFQNPDNEEKGLRADVVCSTNNIHRWTQLTLFLRRDPLIGQFCRSLRLTKEIILQGVNIETRAYRAFITSKSKDQKAVERFFDTTLHPDLVPADAHVHDIYEKRTKDNGSIYYEQRVMSRVSGPQ